MCLFPVICLESALGTETVHVTDFDFHIDLSYFLADAEPEIFTLGDSIPAYRGKMVKEVSHSTPKPAKGAPGSKFKQPSNVSRGNGYEHGRNSLYSGRSTLKLGGWGSGTSQGGLGYEDALGATRSLLDRAGSGSAGRIRLPEEDPEAGLIHDSGVSRTFSFDGPLVSAAAIRLPTQQVDALDSEDEAAWNYPSSVGSGLPLHTPPLSPWRGVARTELRRLDALRYACWSYGLPPWTPLTYVDRDEGQQEAFRYNNKLGLLNFEGRSYADRGGVRLASRRSIRWWADEYCASEKMLKEFRFKKVCYPLRMLVLYPCRNYLACRKASRCDEGLPAIHFLQLFEAILRSPSLFYRKLSCAGIPCLSDLP